MHRRTLLQAAVALPWLSFAQASGVAAARPAQAFVDSRFPRAAQIARAFDPLALWQPVDGDVTGPWRSLRPALAHEPLLLLGVTTESFPFCLEILAREHGAPRLQQSRCDQDLIAWRLEVLSHG